MSGLQNWLFDFAHELAFKDTAWPNRRHCILMNDASPLLSSMFVHHRRAKWDASQDFVQRWQPETPRHPSQKALRAMFSFDYMITFST